MNQEQNHGVTLVLKSLNATLIASVNQANTARHQPDTKPEERATLTAFMNDAVTFNQRIFEYAGDLGLMSEGQWKE